MAVLVGGSKAFPGDNNVLVGTDGPDVIFGDEHTAGATAFFPDVPAMGGALASGTGGDDLIKGAGETDFLFGDAYRMAGTGVGGADRLLGGSGDDIIDGDADSMTAAARGGADRLAGGSGDDFLQGDAGDMSGRAAGGADWLSGGAGNDALVGDAIGVRDHARGGDDHLVGGAGADKLEGDGDTLLDHAAGGNDTLLGGAGNDVLIGDAESVTGHARCGADVLDGGPGDDMLYGDGNPTFSNFGHAARGADTFVITKGGGNDTIGDFQPGVDKVMFVGFTAAEIRAALGGQETGQVTLLAGTHHHAGVGGTQLDLGHGDGVDLAGVTHLDASDIIIG